MVLPTLIPLGGVSGKTAPYASAYLPPTLSLPMQSRPAYLLGTYPMPRVPSELSPRALSLPLLCLWLSCSPLHMELATNPLGAASPHTPPMLSLPTS
jgi:hypothetical protein